MLSDAELIAGAEASKEPEVVEGEKTEQVSEEKTEQAEVTSLSDYLENRNDDEGTTEETDGEAAPVAEAEGSTGQSEEGADSDDAPETYTVKYDGEEHEIELSELLKGYGTNKSAQKKFNDASLSRKQSEEFIHQLKTNPWAVLSNPELGLNPRELAESYLAEQLQYEQLTDEQRELIQAKNQLHQFEEQRQIQEKQASDQQMTELTEKYQEEYTTRINTALDAANLPNTEASVRRLAGYMSEALNSDDDAIKNLSDEDLCSLVREDYENDFKMMFSESDAETLQRILGDDVSKTLRKADIKQVVGKPPAATRRPVKGNKNVKKKAPEKVSMDTYHSYLDSL